MKSNDLLLELVKGLIESNDKKTLGAYLQKPDAAAEEAPSGENEMPELSAEELAALESPEEDETEA